jgi:Anti-sigma-K factor rskA, C-terminal
LKTANPATDTAQGHALLYKQGNKKQLVFQLKGLTNTKGTEAYQVWLINDGNRKSAGTFHVCYNSRRRSLKMIFCVKLPFNIGTFMIYLTTYRFNERI